MMMMSSRLSRWTPLFFVCALANLLAAEGLIVAGLTWPTQAISTPGTLVAVHLLTVGWLLLLMLGALFQFVPVITSKPLVSQRIALVTLVAVQGGLIGMICGFSRLGGESSLCACASLCNMDCTCTVGSWRSASAAAPGDAAT